MLDLHRLLVVVRRLFTGNSYGGDIEQYILNRNPKSPADIERYAAEYQYRHGGGQWL